MSWQAAMTGAGTAPRTATYPSARNPPISSSLSTAPGWHARRRTRHFNNGLTGVDSMGTLLK